MGLKLLLVSQVEEEADASGNEANLSDIPTLLQGHKELASGRQTGSRSQKDKSQAPF